MAHFEVPINSNFFVMLEYLVFDLVLAFCVYVLTSKLVGLCNCNDARKNHSTCHLREDARAPLFETGLLTTKKKVFYGVVFVRILSWILIFGTSLLVRGRSEQFSSARVTTRGRFSVFDPRALLAQNLFLRIACMRRSKNSVYYGEIRNGTCEMNRELFTEPPIEFGLTFQPTLISTTGCISGNSSYQQFRCNSTMNTASKARVRCLYNETNGVLNDDVCYINGSAPHTSCFRNVPREQLKNVTFNCGGRGEYRCHSNSVRRRKFSICDNAVISCEGGFGCDGLVNKDGVTRICKNLAEGNLQSHNASCKNAKGLDWNITDWIPFYAPPQLSRVWSLVAIAYGSGEKVKQVKTYRIGSERKFTEVNYLWIGVLAAKIVMVLVLFIVCETLSRRYGVFVVANEEQRLYYLLKTTVHRKIRDTNFRNDADHRMRVMLDDGVVKLYNDDRTRITSDRM